MSVTFRYGLENTDFKRVTEMLSTSYWVPGIEETKLRTAFENSAVVAAAYDGDYQMGLLPRGIGQDAVCIPDGRFYRRKVSPQGTRSGDDKISAVRAGAEACSAHMPADAGRSQVLRKGRFFAVLQTSGFA
jgi:hypothetical protein